MKALLDYTLPGTILAILPTIGYGLLQVADLPAPIDPWWGCLGEQGTLLEMIAYFCLIGIFAFLDHVQPWRNHLRWLTEMGSRQGRRLAGVPIVNLSMLLGCLLMVPDVAPYAPTVVEPTFYLVGPLIFPLFIMRLTGRPSQLDDVISKSILLQEYAADGTGRRRACPEDRT